MNEKLLASLGLHIVINLQQINAEKFPTIISGINFFQLLILMIQGLVLVANIRLEGWRDKMPICLLKCDKHGYQLTYRAR